MRNIDFFMVGAPKCGTTSLAGYLAEHPGIFMTDPKEPSYFCKDDLRMNELRKIRTLQEYQRLLANVPPADGLLAGEASTLYLASPNAVGAILGYNPAAVFVVMMRNPLELAQSYHSEVVYAGMQKVADFSKAWRERTTIAHGAASDGLIPDPRLLDYGYLCKLGDQLERLYHQVPRERVHVIFLEDMKANVREVYENTLRFLGKPSDGRVDFPVLNQRKEARYRWLVKLVRTCARDVARPIKARLGLSHGTGLLRRLENFNRVEVEQAKPDGALRDDLIRFFADDVKKLGRLTGRDLTHWLH
ncbi:sulfotransferase [Methylolobus aquaticus]|nr:sulfotransferase [Methylolobus aquaticus]